MRGYGRVSSVLAVVEYLVFRTGCARPSFKGLGGGKDRGSKSDKSHVSDDLACR